MPQRRDYSTKKYRNPLFSRKNCSLKKRIFYWFGLLIVFSGLIYFLFYSEFFEIKKIEVAGANQLKAAEIIDFINQGLAKRRFLIFKQSNVFALNKTELQKEILNHYFLNEVKIRRVLPNALKVEIFEKLSALVWITGNQAYYLDLLGKVTGQVTSQQITQVKTKESLDIFRHQIIAKDLPVIYDLENRGVTVGQKVTSSKIIDNIFELIKTLPRKINYDIAYFNFSLRRRELEAVMTDGWKIKFSVDNDLDLQLKNLTLLLQEKIKNPKDLNYIDLRFGERVFYK